MNKEGIKQFVPEELKGFRKIVLSISSYISSLIDIGYGSGSEKATATVLVLASVFLSIASGYTTYSGLTQYTPPFIAGLITLGVQGLLFGVSWRLGKLYIAGEINPAMWVIWFVTMLVSVFFSYSSLFSTVFSEEQRKENREISSITVGSNILRNLDEDLKNEYSNKKKNINNSSYIQWKSKINIAINNSIKYGENELQGRLIKYNLLLNKYKKEIRVGGTVYTNSNGKEAVTRAGSGEIADKYKKEAEKYKTYDLDPYKKTSENFLNSRQIILKNIADFDKSKNVEKLNNAYNACVDLVAKIEEKTLSCSPELLGENFPKLVEVKKRLDDFQVTCSNKILEKSSNDIINNLRSCIRLAGVPEEKANNYLSQISTLQRNEGNHTHFFIVIINELKRLNYLAIGTFILAVIMDLLILLCSLVASKHNTFLSISSGKDLLQMKNYPLDIILGTNVTPSDSDNEMTRRIKFILNNSYFTLKYLDKKCSMVIPIDKILELKMHKELGTFFAMNLARPFEKGTLIGFRTNFILWMCEQISKKKQSHKSYSDLHKAFAGEENGK